MDETKQITLDDVPDEEGPSEEDEMTMKERIDFIRENGTEAMKAGLRSILDGNKYKPKKERMWEEQLKGGRRMVKTIQRKRD